MLLLRAVYLVRAGLPNVAVLMFTRSLREYVLRGTGHYGLANDKVKTIAAWMYQLIGEQHGSVPSKQADFEAWRRAMAAELTRIFDKRPALQGHLDCILVDEVQDCLPEEIALFRRAAKQVFFAGDRRQQIHHKTELIADLKATSGLVTKELKKHYRNGVSICKTADIIGKTFGEEPLVGTCNYDETGAKSSVVFERCSDDQALIAKLGARLEQQLKAYPGELLGVACPRNEDVGKVEAGLAANGRLVSHLSNESNLASADKKRCIYVCTMHDAKGLEFRAMHIAFAEHVNKMKETQKRLAFTTLTRAKTSLAVYHIAPLPAYFEQAAQATAAVKLPPDPRDLFPGKR